MAYANYAYYAIQAAAAAATVYEATNPQKPPKAPAAPNQNQAQNDAVAAEDQMRQRRGVLSNIYAGSSNQAPVVGKTQLGA